MPVIGKSKKPLAAFVMPVTKLLDSAAISSPKAEMSRPMKGALSDSDFEMIKQGIQDQNSEAIRSSKTDP